MDTTEFKPPRLIARPAVEEMTLLSRSSIYQKISHGEFPPPVRLGTGRVAWVYDEVVAWVEARIAERDGGGDGGVAAAEG